MDKENLNTKTALILASGPIFAEKGLEGASVRAIAKAADANVASVNYHFGTKENLYLEAFKYVVGEVHTEYLHEAWNLMPLEERLPENIIRMIKKNLRDCFDCFFRKNHPLWFYILLHREMCNPGKAFMCLKKNVIEPVHQAAREIFAIMKPDAGKWEADVWIMTMHGFLLFTATTMNANRTLYGWETGGWPEDYLEQVITTSTKSAMAMISQ